jgi:murein DD-endopeptidase MepM/ murein hydrolase activator NlpD
VGQRVSAGTLVGFEGSTGNSTGVHLHFEVRQDGAPLDPVPWLADRGVDLHAPDPG